MKFECCDWITEEEARVECKREVSREIDAFCKYNPVNKHRLLQRHHIGYYIALLSAIQLRPEPRDWELIQQMKPGKLPRGFAQYKLMDAVEVLKASNNINTVQLKKLQAWLKTLSANDPKIVARIDSLVSQ